jgi:hypothetical protein
MAAPWNPPVKGEDFDFAITLADMVTAGKFKSSPTIAAGDFKVSKDGGSFANLATLPSVEPSASVSVKVGLSATEMTADRVLIVWEDQTDPPEWASGSVCILTTSA